MNSKKRSKFDLDMEPINISKFRINPDLLDAIVERKKKRKDK